MTRRFTCRLPGIMLACLLALAASACGRPSPAGSVRRLHAPSLLTEREAAGEAVRNPDSTLSVPTDIRRFSGLWFIVDCYHDRILYHTNLEDPLTSWSVLTDEISRGHTIDSDGTVYLADDTEQNRVLVFERDEDEFVMTQVFENIGRRPHEIQYRAEDRTFYCWSSESGEMYLFRRDDSDDRVYLEEIRSVPLLAGTYVRSFTVVRRGGRDEIWFVSGTPTAAGYAAGYSPSVVVCDLATFSVKERWPVADEMAGMVQITPAGGWYYITISTDNTGNQGAADLVRVRSPEDLASGNAERLYAGSFDGGGGTPYIIRMIDGEYYLAEHRANKDAVWRFSVGENGISAAHRLYPQDTAS